MNKHGEDEMEKKTNQKKCILYSTCIEGENCREGMRPCSHGGDRFTIVFFRSKTQTVYFYLLLLSYCNGVYIYYTHYYVVVIDDGLHASQTNGTTHIVDVVLFISKTRVCDHLTFLFSRYHFFNTRFSL